VWFLHNIPDRFHKKQNGVRNVHREVTKVDDESFLWAQAKRLPKGGKDLPMTVEKFFTLLVKNLAWRKPIPASVLCKVDENAHHFARGLHHCSSWR
jgi:hypothetical protein